MHYYKRNIGDYHKKAGRLSIVEHGIYMLLIDACYDREIFPTQEQAIDWVWARSDEEVAAVKFVLKKFFELVDGVFVQKRIQEEIAAYKKKCRKNSEIAKNREDSKRNDNEAPQEDHETCSSNHETCSNGDSSSTNEHLTNNHKPITNKKETHPSDDTGVSIWDVGVPIFKKQGIDEKSARSFIGKIIKTHGEKASASALAEASLKNPADIRGYLVGILNRQKSEDDEEAAFWRNLK